MYGIPGHETYEGEEVGDGFFELELEGMVVDGFDADGGEVLGDSFMVVFCAGEVVEAGSVGGAEVFGEDALVAEKEVVGSDGVAIGPFGIVS